MKNVAHFFAWGSLEYTNEWLIYQRNLYCDHLKKHDIPYGLVDGMNYTIISNSAILIEGYTELFLTNRLNIRIEQEEVKDNPLLIRFFDQALTRIEKATYKDFNELFKLIVDKTLDKVLNNKIYQGYLHLFKLRNVLIHGNCIKVDNVTDTKTNDILSEYTAATIREVYNYLRSLDLVPDSETKSLDIEIIINSKSADHFFEIAKQYRLALQKTGNGLIFPGSKYRWYKDKNIVETIFYKSLI